MLKHGILGLLNYGSMTGYDIVQIFRDSLSYFWHAQTSQIYRELQTLKRNSWATDETIPQEGRPDKKIFTITDKGRDELKRWLREENAESEVRSPLMMKVFFPIIRMDFRIFELYDGVRHEMLDTDALILYSEEDIRTDAAPNTEVSHCILFKEV